MKEEWAGDACKSCRPALDALTKEKRRIEAESMKQSAVLSQKIELLTLQLRDAEERDSNFKKMHETMMAALKGDPNDKDQF